MGSFPETKIDPFQYKLEGPRGGLISRGSLQSDLFFCLQVNGPITRGGGWGALVSGSLWYLFVKSLETQYLKA